MDNLNVTFIFSVQFIQNFSIIMKLLKNELGKALILVNHKR